ncbi:MAG: L-ribulose-5-phosphate 4-epimerase AraD [Candidatus Woesearchaeota archaeon]
MDEDTKIQERVAEANKQISERGLTLKTWGNASECTFDRKAIFIKPSGVPFCDVTPENIVKVYFDGRGGDALRPSVDTPIHQALYEGFPEIGGIVHIHSPYATAFAQAKKQIPCLGTTHADYFYGNIPLVDELTRKEIEEAYEANLGRGIVNYFKSHEIKPLDMPAILVPSHGAFTWGRNVDEALERAVVLEEVAKLAYRTINLLVVGKGIQEIDKHLLEKHHQRRRGENKYYGQEE